MSQTTNISDENQPSINTNISMPTQQKIYLYVLRHTTIDEKFKIKAYFNNDIKFTFTRIESIDEKTQTSPYIYRAELDLVINNQRHLFYNDSVGLLPIQNYRLRLSRKFIGDTTFRDYNDEKIRAIDNPYLVAHYFIFDVDFADRVLVDSAPGHNVPFWNQLYIYTFFILRHKMYEVFDILIDQFQIAVKQTKWKLMPEELNEFFQGCSNHFIYSIPPLVNQYVANKILIRMTGILPIKKFNFDLSNREAFNYVLKFLADIKSHYNHILANVTDGEWITFRDGLIFYLSVELVSQAVETINLIDQTENVQCKKDLANCLLKRLEELQRPVLGVNWTNLFLQVDPNILSIKQLELSRTIRSYVTCLVHLFGNKTNDIEISKKIDRQFDELIRTDRLPVNLDNLFFLIKFLQLESTETNEKTKDIYKMVNSTIESSAQLRDKIQRYLYSLKILIDQFEHIQFIISSISKSSILFNVKRRDLLMNLMMNSLSSYSYEFFKQWFYSFLLFDDEITEINKKDYQDLLQHWSNQFLKFMI